MAALLAREPTCGIVVLVNSWIFHVLSYVNYQFQTVYLQLYKL